METFVVPRLLREWDRNRNWHFAPAFETKKHQFSGRFHWSPSTAKLTLPSYSSLGHSTGRAGVSRAPEQLEDQGRGWRDSAHGRAARP